MGQKREQKENQEEMQEETKWNEGLGLVPSSMRSMR